jgi:hypothetical protein
VRMSGSFAIKKSLLSLPGIQRFFSCQVWSLVSLAQFCS